MGCVQPKGLSGQVLEQVVLGLGERQREAKRPSVANERQRE